MYLTVEMFHQTQFSLFCITKVFIFTSKDSKDHCILYVIKLITEDKKFSDKFSPMSAGGELVKKLFW